MSRRGWFHLTLPALILCVMLGVGMGIGAYTFHYAEGGSYFSDDPKACVNCHIMRDQFDGWQKASHHAAATCVDCHLSHDNIAAKYATKGFNGFFHSKAFTMQDFHEPIRIHEFNSRILQDNCVRCHQGLVCDILAPEKLGGGPNCVHCHQHAGHGPAR
jgi:cytochrome c nitrite reductase small subunit